MTGMVSCPFSTITLSSSSVCPSCSVTAVSRYTCLRFLRRIGRTRSRFHWPPARTRSEGVISAIISQPETSSGWPPYVKFRSSTVISRISSSSDPFSLAKFSPPPHTPADHPAAAQPPVPVLLQEPSAALLRQVLSDSVSSCCQAPSASPFTVISAEKISFS